MIAAAGAALQAAAFCPAHSGEKSPLPRLSAFARRGARAAAARGNGGAASLSGPISRTSRFTIDRARPAGEDVGDRGRARGVALQRGPVHRAGRGLGAEQIGRADLDAGGTERHRRRDAARVADAARGDHRHLHRIDDLRHQRHRAELRRQVGRQKQAAMAARLDPLRDDDVDAARFQPAGFIDRRRRREDLRAPGPHPGEQGLRGQAEMEAHHRRLERGERVGHLRR